MKYHRAAKILFFINLLYLHCLPNNCDIKQDAPIQSEKSETHKDLPVDSNKAENVPTQQEEIKKTNINLENLEKENVEPNVEYINNVPKEKDIKPTIDRIGQIDPIHVSVHKLRLAEAALKGSRPINQPNEVTDTLKKEKKAKSIINDAIGNDQTEELPEMLSKSHLRDSTEKLKISETTATETLPVTETLVDNNLKDVHAAAAVAYEKGMDDSMHQQYDGMPSFDEWKKMMLSEQEKDGQKVSSPTPPGKKISSQKRRRNYSSYECGAKIVAANNEAEGKSRILNELVDEYMLNPCKAKIWFVIELCETVQASQIELANFELFSSCPKDFAVYSSDNFPTRDWVPLGTFTAVEQRVLQSFELKQEGFGKFIKIELLSHYGHEHYCPLSIVRIFGTSMVDEYEEMETLSNRPDIPDDDLDRLDMPIEDKKSTNIFGSATDAVMNIVKKAAQALGQQAVDENEKNETSDSHNVSESKICSMVESSSNKCEDVPVAKDSLSYLQSLSSSASVHQSFFRLLHRCDQCVSSGIRYYTPAQPHCRFFQAALGPVVFQTLCDWFKEHPLAVAHESPAPGKKSVPNGTFIVSPTKSPPPQIIRISSSENDLTLTKLLNESLLSTDSEQIVTINVTTLSIKTNKSASVQDTVVLQSSIKPTQTLHHTHSSSYNDNITTFLDNVSNETVMPSADSVNEQFINASVSIPSRTEGSDISETATLIVGDFTTSNEILSESEQQQINEFLSDSSTVSSDDLTIEIMPATELPPAFKSGEEKLMDMRNEIQGKMEPAALSGSATAGQKESVFMRMSNRIKALEINMSLSSQYLQELSQRYRRQMDEMQRAFNRTVERDLKQQEILNKLQLKVANLSETVELLLNERYTLYRQMIETHIFLMAVEAIIMITIMSLCIRRISTTKQSVSGSMTTVVSPSRLSKRRNSADSCSTPIARKVTKRSNSEEILNAEDLIIKPQPVLLDPILRVKRKNRKRNKGIHRSVSNSTVECTNSSHCTEKHHIHSDGCMPLDVKPKPQPNKSNHICENCDNNICTAEKTAKDHRPSGMPLQNLTNGSVMGSMDEKDALKNKEKFSFKKFLRFQKRDSI